MTAIIEVDGFLSRRRITHVTEVLSVVKDVVGRETSFIRIKSNYGAEPQHQDFEKSKVIFVTLTP